jgi:glutathione S-transferase
VLLLGRHVAGIFRRAARILAEMRLPGSGWLARRLLLGRLLLGRLLRRCFLARPPVAVMIFLLARTLPALLEILVILLRVWHAAPVLLWPPLSVSINRRTVVWLQPPCDELWRRQGADFVGDSRGKAGERDDLALWSRRRIMRQLFQYPLQPQSRLVRLQLAEKRLDVELVAERPWDRRDGFLRLNPAGEIPVLVEENGQIVAGFHPIVEYLEEAYPDTAGTLLGRTVAERAEIRRLVCWFAEKFDREVTRNLLAEKIFKRFMPQGGGGPDSGAIRAGKANIGMHLDYIGWLMERRTWLAGTQISLADFMAAAQISAIDYLGDVPWAQHEAAKDWYARMKSRPSFRPLLADNLPGAPPPAHYADLDF